MHPIARHPLREPGYTGHICPPACYNWICQTDCPSSKLSSQRIRGQQTLVYPAEETRKTCSSHLLNCNNFLSVVKSSLWQITSGQTPTCLAAAGWWQTCKADALRKQNLWHEGSSIMEKDKAISSSLLRVTSFLCKKLNGYESPFSSLARMNVPWQLTVVPLSHSSLMATSMKQTEWYMDSQSLKSFWGWWTSWGKIAKLLFDPGGLLSAMGYIVLRDQEKDLGNSCSAPPELMRSATGQLTYH